MSDVRETQVLVIGGGPGGYPAALHAADHGLQTTLVDADPRLGGVCLNRGCIPSKALLHIAKVVSEARELHEFGIDLGTPKFDVDKIRSFVQQRVIAKMNSGIDGLCKSRGVNTIRARARFEDSRTVQLLDADGNITGRVRYQHCVLATGSVPAMPKAFAIGDPRVMDSTSALQLPDIPARLLVVGGGYIGLEIGTVYAAMGTKVTVVEFMDGLLPMADRDLVEPLDRRLRKMFDAIYLNTKVASLVAHPTEIVATLEGKDVPPSLAFDRVLVAIGRRANSDGLGLENTRVQLDERKFVIVDKQRRTHDPHIYAVGDVAGEPGLAHKATAEARVAVEAICGEPTEFAPRAIPAVIFTDPEIAWAGLTEMEAKKSGRAIEVHKFPWMASGRATALARNDGLTKIIVEPKTQRVLGVGIVGAGAGELIAEGTLAIEMGAVARDLAETIHPHPTLSETLMEGAEGALGGSTHLPRLKKTVK